MTPTLPPTSGTVDPAQVDAARRRRARMAEAERRSKFLRRLETPEGARIQLRLATAIERAGAFLIDVAIQWAILIVTGLGLAFASWAMNVEFANIAGAVWLVFFFFVRNFYYIFFELGTKAATPGKRALGMRVASRSGSRLTADSVLARNFIREIEVGLPLQFLLMGGDRISGWIALFGLAWSGIFLLFPLFNRDRMRVGDLIAGTWVIKNPKAKLMGDVSSTTGHAQADRYVFSPQQADAYGIHELHVLEDVLRQSTTDVKAQVALRIRQKIGWTSQPGDTDTAFLEAYYAALRRRLEQRMLLGDRKTDKFDIR